LKRTTVKQFLRLSAAMALLELAFFARPAFATIRYQISLSHPEQHIFHVTMQLVAQEGERDLTVALPAWDALYQIRDFSYRVRDVRATQSAVEATPLSIQKIDKQTWRISLSPSEVRTVNISYSIEWDDPGPFSSQLNTHHAFLNFAEVLMYVPSRRGEDTLVSFGGVPDGWKTIAALPAGPFENSFTAASYDALVDAPVEAGKFDEFEFDSGGAHFCVVMDTHSYRKGPLENALKRITAYQLQLMGGPPFKEYTFIFHIGPYSEIGAGGGMEHMNSTAIATGSLESAISVAAHEFFHVWNVKRIRPQALEPVDFTKEQYTRSLWFAEGVTNTYQYYTLERTGLWSKEAFLGDLAEQICELEARPARLWQSAEESSMDAWFEKYDFYNRPDRSIWYYNKGQILGVLLDLEIRAATENRKSLDDVFRLMNEKYARRRKFYDDSTGIRSAVEEVAGTSFQSFFEKYVSGTDSIPYDELFRAGGLELKIEKQDSANYGFWPSPTLNGMMVAAVESGSAAEAAGVREGDILVELNGEPFPRRFSTWLGEQSPGQKVNLRVRRDGEEKDFSFALGAHSDQRCSLTDAPHPTEKQRRIRDGLLHGTTD
jgi:predicted metalloprotease with PDZ domain